MGSKNGHFREFGKFRLDAENKLLWADEKPINLQLKEIELLCLLTERRGEILTKDEILDRVWADSFVEESNLAQHIYRLRKKFKELGETDELIQTVPRRGYRFVGEINDQNNGDLVIERHSFSKTFVQEIENSEEPNALDGPIKNIDQKVNRRLLPIGIGMCVLAAIAVGVYAYNSRLAGVGQPIRSIAVLPLRSLEGEEGKILGMGFADTLTTSLGRIDELKVVSSRSAGRYLDEITEPVDIGRKLNVDAVIDGTLQQANGKYRVTLRITRTADGKQIWSTSFDKPESEIFQLQDLIALETSRALELNLRTQTKHETANVGAYQFYLQGLYIFRRRGTSNFNSAPLFKKAIELDPQFAKAYAGLAGVYAIGVSMEEAETTVNKALELDPNLADAHAVRGFIKIFLDWDWNEAEKSLNRAVELDKNSVEAHHWRGILYQIRGRFDEAKADVKRALELDPTSANMTSDLGHIYYSAREFEEAERLFKSADAMESNIAIHRLIWLYELQGRENEALQAKIQSYCSRLNDEKRSECEEPLRKSFEQNGIKGIAQDDIAIYLEPAQKKDVTSDIGYGLARSYLQIGDKEKALESLTRSLETKARYELMNFGFPFIKFDPIFDEIRDDPKFKALLDKLNL